VKYELRPKKQMTIYKIKITERDCFICEIRAVVEERVNGSNMQIKIIHSETLDTVRSKPRRI